jgi:hypothetical protein
MPRTDSILSPNDKASKLLFDISSTLPENLAENAKSWGCLDVEAGVKTFMSNVTQVEKFLKVLYFGSEVRIWLN